MGSSGSGKAGLGIVLSMDERLEMVSAYARALGREANVVAGHREILWQQIHNWLQWEGDKVREQMEPARAKRSVRGSRPWIRIMMPPGESGSLVQTVPLSADPSFEPTAVHVSPNGRYVLLTGPVSPGNHYVWDRRTRAERLTRGTDISFSPGSMLLLVRMKGRLVSGHWESTYSVHLEDPATGQQGAALYEQSDPITCLDLSPDERWLALGCKDGTIRVWDLAQRRLHVQMKSHDGPMSLCLFTRDGTRILTAGQFPNGGGAGRRVWDRDSGHQVFYWEGRAWPFTREECDLSPDGLRVAMMDTDGCKVFDLRTGELLWKLGATTGAVFDNSRYSPDGRQMLVHGGRKASFPWIADPKTGSQVGVLKAGTQAGLFSTVGAFSPDGEQILTVSGPEIKFWDAARVEADSTEQTAWGGAAVAFNRDGSRLLSSPSPAILWDTRTGGQIETYGLRRRRQSDGTVKTVQVPAAITFSADGRVFLSAVESEPVRLCGSQSGQVLREFGDPWQDDPSALSPSGDLVLTGGHGQPDCEIWDAATGTKDKTIHLDGRPLEASFGPDGLRVAIRSTSAGAGGLFGPPKFHLWDLQNDLRLASSEGRSCVFSPDGRYVAFDQSLWDARTGQDLHVPFGAFSPDSRLVLSLPSEGSQELEVWDCVGLRRVATLQGHTAQIRDFCVSPDATKIASASDDSTVRLWVSETGRAVGILSHSLPVEACRFSGDGRYLYSVTRDKLLTIWDIGSGSHSEIIACLPLPRMRISADTLVFHDHFPMLAWGTESGFVQLGLVQCLTPGPTVVTAADRGAGARVLCPVCISEFPVAPGQLGMPIPCANADCGEILRVNSFVADMRP
jgi:WD40 repeat protein